MSFWRASSPSKWSRNRASTNSPAPQSALTASPVANRLAPASATARVNIVIWLGVTGDLTRGLTRTRAIRWSQGGVFIVSSLETPGPEGPMGRAGGGCYPGLAESRGRLEAARCEMPSLRIFTECYDA